MKILVMSDLHAEFYSAINFYSFVMSLDPEDIDVLILAGDICTAGNMLETMNIICQRFSNSKVVWVHGNHEYYGSTRENVYRLSKQCEIENHNLKWLNGNYIEINGRRIIGHTMWYCKKNDNFKYERYMNDFIKIFDLKNWVYEENKRGIKSFEEHCRPGDIIVSHHLPSQKSVAEKFKTSDLNRFFVCDVEKQIKELRPALWIHGHTHYEFNYQLYDTTVICNPRGYHTERELNGQPSFNKSFVTVI